MTVTRARQKTETRERLLEAARSAFARGSVVTTPLDVVAAGAGVSKATLFFHFATRAELLRATAAGLYDELEPAVTLVDGATTVEHLARFLGVQHDRRVVLLWKIGDVLAADGEPLADLVYAGLVRDLALLARRDGIAAADADAMAGLLAPATFMLARRIAFGSARPDEAAAFLDHVGRLLAIGNRP